MRFFRFKSFQNQLILTMILIIAVFSIIVSFVYFPEVHNSLWEEKRAKVQNLIQSQMVILEHYYQLSQDGEMSEAKAKAKAKAAIEKARYGDKERGYFWINDMQPKMIMHPYKPQLNGEDLSEVRDEEGMYLFNRFVEVAKDKGAGFVEYHWQYYDNADRVEPKLSYVQEFEPWGWILGTGVYVNDVWENIVSMFIKITLLGLAVTALMAVGIYFLARRMTSPILDIERHADSIAQGKMDVDRLKIDRSDEIGSLAEKVNIMTDEIRETINYYETVLEDMATPLVWSDQDAYVKKFNKAAAMLVEEDDKERLIGQKAGLATQAILAYYKLLPKKWGMTAKDADLSETLTVIHDDIDLPLGKYKTSIGSRSGGHNGIESIITHLKTKNFKRIRVGIAPQEGNISNAARFVLQKFTQKEEKILNEIIDTILKEEL